MHFVMFLNCYKNLDGSDNFSMSLETSCVYFAYFFLSCCYSCRFFSLEITVPWHVFEYFLLAYFR